MKESIKHDLTAAALQFAFNNRIAFADYLIEQGHSDLVLSISDLELLRQEENVKHYSALDAECEEQRTTLRNGY